MNQKIYTIIAVVFLLIFLGRTDVYAQTDRNDEEILEGRVEKIIAQDEIFFTQLDIRQPHQILEILVTKGSLKDNLIRVENGDIPTTNIITYNIGDELVIVRNWVAGQNQFYITDYVRRKGLFALALVFLAVTLVVGKISGALSLFGMTISYLVIMFFILPQISLGRDPVLIAIVGSIFMVPVTFYLSHGYNTKTHISVGSTIVSLIITGLLANFFVQLTKLTGFGSEEAGFLQDFYQGNMDIRGLLLAGIIIGGLGIFDDITVSQSSIVAELRAASSKLSAFELYKRAMNVGHDHISSLINTLILVYTGAALPLLLLFNNSSRPFAQIINYEFMAEEIVRTLVASIGLILSVPITTGIAAIVFSNKPKRKVT